MAQTPDFDHTLQKLLHIQKPGCELWEKKRKSYVKVDTWRRLFRSKAVAKQTIQHRKRRAALSHKRPSCEKNDLRAPTIIATTDIARRIIFGMVKKEGGRGAGKDEEVDELEGKRYGRKRSRSTSRSKHRSSRSHGHDDRLSSGKDRGRDKEKDYGRRERSIVRLFPYSYCQRLFDLRRCTVCCACLLS
ncbi:hypothetical protein BV22DRAFT_915193 [Leucogyrophana mollusca]|uniref:Uncharacterized protein n=1 Tax=Leucogyrophana mollusca TaxID=85980 RepID=A0ACB8AYA0_9AGAM|nr:hypothetical protein BV22DRAFT_915193 [Leucogyrophana mollusca]